MINTHSLDAGTPPVPVTDIPYLDVPRILPEPGTFTMTTIPPIPAEGA